ncbi:MAG: CotH kinase family protein [Eubacterium sp.]|nr:CotH kinase family protein [Eubacterium sp.]
MRKRLQIIKRASVTVLVAAMMTNCTTVTGDFFSCPLFVKAAEEEEYEEHTQTDGVNEHTKTDAAVIDFEDDTPYEMHFFDDIFLENHLYFSNKNAMIEECSDGIHISGKNKDLQGQRLIIGKKFDFEEGACTMYFDAISKRGKKVMAKFYLDDEETPFAEYKLPLQKKKDDWSTDGEMRIELPANVLTGEHSISIEFYDEDTLPDKNTEVSLRDFVFFKQTGIPVMDINIDESYTPIDDMNEDMAHATECYGKISIFVPEGFNSGYSDEGQTEYTGGEYKLDYIRGRGNSTWGESKKPYKIKLEEAANLFGMGTDKHWTLIANHFDNSLIRNRITYYLGEKLGMEYTPQIVPIDVNMNGEYIGSYYLCEQIRIGSSRVDLDDLENIESDSEDISGGYLLQFDSGSANDGYNFFTHMEMPLQVASPKEISNSNISEAKLDEMNQYIEEYVNKTEEAIYGDDFKDTEGKPYTEYLDLDSAAKYYLIQGFSRNNDAYYTSSTYLYKKKNGKLYWGPLWDFDFVAWGSYDYTKDPRSWGAYIPSCSWFNRLLLNEEFRNKVLEVWGGQDSEDPSTLYYQLNELIKEGGILDQYEAQMTTSAENNFAKWGMTSFENNNEEYEGEMFSCENYHDEIERLRTWISKRMEWFDKTINDKSKCRFYDGDELVFETDIYMGQVPASEPENPQKDGYVFDGWYPKNVDEEHEDGEFYAKWIPENEIINLEKIHVLEKEIYMEVAQDTDISYSLIPEGAWLGPQGERITLVSSDESIVSVLEKTIYANDVGDAEITVCSPGGITETIIVHVLPEIPEEQEVIVNINEKDVEMKLGETKAIDFNVEPEIHLPLNIRTANLNPEVASMDETGVITAKSVGKAYIVVFYNDSDENIVIKVDVKAGEEDKPDIQLQTEDKEKKNPEAETIDAVSKDKPDKKKDDTNTSEKNKKTKVEKLKKGTEFEKGNLKYEVTKAGKLKNGKVTGGKVRVVGFSAKGVKAKTVTVKDTISYEGNTFKITEVCNKAFTGNDNITKVTIGKNVTRIGKCAFNECENLKKLVIKGKNVKFRRKAFKGTNVNLKAYVPAAKLKTYKKRLSKVGLTKEQVVRKEK